jgi:hypothetical protein
MKIAYSYLLAASAAVVGGLAATAGNAPTAATAVAAVPPSAPPVASQEAFAVPVAATQSGTWNVGLVGVPSVNIANAPAVNLSNTAAAPLFVRNMDDHGRNAYQSVNVVQPGNCSGQSCFFLAPRVPAGHRLVVEHVSGSVTLALNSKPNLISIDVDNASGTGILGFSLPPPYPPGGVISFERSVLFYVDENQPYIFQAFVDPASSFDSGSSTTFVATGYLVDCGAGSCQAIGQ